MRCRVYPLRRRGRRLPWRQAQNSPVFEGELRTHYLSLDNARYFVASLVRPGDALCKPMLPELWEPILVNAGNWVLVLRGFERVGDDPDGSATVQEWRCEVLRSEHRLGP
jgi:hypothetical protein